MKVPFVCATAVVSFLLLSVVSFVSASVDTRTGTTTTTTTTTFPALRRAQISLPSPTCGCGECSQKVLNAKAGDATCQERIEHLMQEAHFSEHDACLRVGRTEFPSICSPCDPGRCDGKTVPEEEDQPAFYCGCPSCTPEVWNQMTLDYTCGARISFLTDVKNYDPANACIMVSKTQFPNECQACNPETCGVPASALATEDTAEDSFIVIIPFEETYSTTEEDATDMEADHYCGCAECTEEVWNADADGSTCGERISYLTGELQDRFPTETEACHQVAFNEFPAQCGRCNPGICDNNRKDVPLTARSELYCFEPFENRTRYRNQFGQFTTEVKEGESCGPSNNKFTTNTVESVDKHNLKLKFMKNGSQWEASEVRMRLPEAEMPFSYGRFTFSIKSVEVIDSDTGEVIDTTLPPSLVLGLFTWDTTENYDIHENFNHETDIEISRWNDPMSEDAQFLVQPPGGSQTLRFFSGPNNTYQQAPRIYSFDWSPGEIVWTSDIPGAENFTYSTQIALDQGEEDFTQCLPADIEIRMNLWNMFGSTTPTGMQDNHVVEVLIDKVEYEPSGLLGVPDGGRCTKDCQCLPTSSCFGNTCAADTERRLEEGILPEEFPDENEFFARLDEGRGGAQHVTFVGIFVLSMGIAIGMAVLIVVIRRSRVVIPTMDETATDRLLDA